MFYLKLPSNSSMDHYPDNNTSHYYTKLPQAIDLKSSDYEVGLSEILFNNSYLNIEEKSVGFSFELMKREISTKKCCPRNCTTQLNNLFKV